MQIPLVKSDSKNMHSGDSIQSEEGLMMIVYVSSATVLFSESELEALLSTSRKNNLRDEITGVLLYVDGSILQAFEGPTSAVHALNRRIAKDARHKGIIHLLVQPVDQRSFPDWTMGLIRSSRKLIGDIDGLNDYLDGNVASSLIGDRKLIILLEQFVRSSRTCAA